MVATLALCFGLALCWSRPSSRRTSTWPASATSAVSLGAGLLVLGMWALTGFLLGTLARGPALSVGLGLVWALVVENLLRGVGELLGPVEAFTNDPARERAPGRWSGRSSAPSVQTRLPACSTR